MQSLKRGMNNIYKIFLISVILYSAFSNATEIYSVEWVAENIAKNHNDNASILVDNMVVSTSASSIGKNVIFYYVLKVQKNLSVNKLKDFKKELIKEIVPKVCQANKESEAFNKGLFYTFIYPSLWH